MQIKLEDVSYKKLNNLNFAIEDKKITGIVSNDINNLIDLNFIIKNNIKQSGNIKYNVKNIKNKIKIISISDIDYLTNDDINNIISSNKNEELWKLLGIEDKLLNKDINTLSTSEKIRILFVKVLNENPDTILIDGIFEQLDKNYRKKVMNLIINLKKFHNKTIILSCIDVDIIYEYVDSIVFIINGNSYFSKDKYTLFDNENILNNVYVSIPFIKKIENIIKNKKNIDLGNNENVNELIKAIYREVR